MSHEMLQSRQVAVDIEINLALMKMYLLIVMTAAIMRQWSPFAIQSVNVLLRGGTKPLLRPIG